MKKFCFLALCLLLTTVASLYAQKFETSYGLPGTESGSDVAELSDGSIITVGTSDAYGAGANDMLVVKSSAGGTLLWAKYFGGSGDDAAMAVTIGPDDEIYVAGSTMNGTDKNGMLVKLNRHGQHLWTKTYGGALADEINDIGIRAGRVYMAGSSGNTGFQDMWFLKTDTAGILKENKTHGFAQNEQAQALAFTSDGNLVLSGRTGSFAGFNVYVVKMNLSGDTLWTKKFNLYLNAGTSTLPSGSGIAELSNQDLIVTGTGRDGIGNYSSTFHLRLGSAGNTLYTKWTSLLSDGGQDVAAGKNGSYYLLITSCNFGCPIVLKKFDLSGVETLYKTYQYPGGNSYATFASPGRMRVVSGARLLITGTSFLNANNADLYLARLDSNGVAYTNAAPGIIASGPLNFCSGGQVILSVPAGYTKYSWGRISQNQLSYPGGSNDSLLVNSGGSYFCTMWSSTGMRTTALVNVTVNPQPAASISASGPTAFCSGLGQSVALSVPSGFTTCQWNLNGSPVSGAVSSGYTATASGSYTVTVTNSCGTATSAPLSVNASVPPASSISCSGFYCYSGPAPCGMFPDPLSVTNYGAGATYQWYLNGNAYASGVFSLQPGYPAGNYTCTITTPCGTSTSAPYTVFAGPGFGIYEITSASQSSGCGVPASILLEAPFEGTSPFQWYLNGVLISGANASSYQASASGTYTVDFYEPNCMSMMGSEPFYCQLNTPARTISAAAGTSVCSGSVSLTASPAGAGIQYQWYRNNVMISGAISSVYPATTTGIYKCSINNPSCGSGFSNELAVNVGLPAPGIVISNATICSGQSSLVFCNPDYGSLYTYQWKLNNTNLPGANASSYAAGQAGNYTCVATNACGSATSNSVSLAVNALPPSAISYSGVASLCTGQSKVLTAPAGAGYAYQWYRNNAMLGGATLQSYTATSAASYTVRVTSSNGCTAVSNPPAVLSALSIPVATIRATQYPQVCAGSTLNLKAVSGNYTYQWFRDGVSLGAAVDSVLTAGTAGTYTVSLTNACGTSVSSGISLTVKSKPTAQITPGGALSFCAGDSVVLQANTGNAYTYSWWKGANALPGATSSAFIAKVAGNYKVNVTNKFGCARTSAPVSVTVPCRTEVTAADSDGLQVYPNPSSGDFTIRFTDLVLEERVQVQCMDMAGRELPFSILQDSEHLMLQGLSPGICMLKITTGERVWVKRLIKL